jgi:hypothetical protein
MACADALLNVVLVGLGIPFFDLWEACELTYDCLPVSTDARPGSLKFVTVHHHL